MSSGVPAPDGGVDPGAPLVTRAGGPLLVAFAGLPGVGTLAVRVGAALRAPVLPVDPAERASTCA